MAPRHLNASYPMTRTADAAGTAPAGCLSTPPQAPQCCDRVGGEAIARHSAVARRIARPESIGITMGRAANHQAASRGRVPLRTKPVGQNRESRS